MAVQVDKHEKIAFLFGVRDEFFEVKYLRKYLFFAGSKFSIKIIPDNTSTIVTKEDAVNIKHGQNVEAKIEVFEP